jgi:hypothetical protein
MVIRARCVSELIDRKEAISPLAEFLKLTFIIYLMPVRTEGTEFFAVDVQDQSSCR